MISGLIVHQANGDSDAFELVLEKAAAKMDAESGGEISFKDARKKFEADRERTLASEEARKTAAVCAVLFLLQIGPELSVLCDAYGLSMCALSFPPSPSLPCSISLGFPQRHPEGNALKRTAVMMALVVSLPV
jgi:hypothetical protein